MSDFNLIVFLREIEDEYYCIIKRNNIIEFRNGADIDIFCYDLTSFTKKIIKASKIFIKNGYELKINDEIENHWHLDLCKENTISVRFDIYNTLPSFKKVNVKKAFFACVLENRVEEKIMINNNKLKVYYPALIDELIIRYIEYIENYKLRPDKIKHLEYIMRKLDENTKNKVFIDKLHYYTSFTKDLNPKPKIDLFLLFKEILEKIRLTPLKQIPIKSIAFIRKRLQK